MFLHSDVVSFGLTINGHELEKTSSLFFSNQKFMGRTDVVLELGFSSVSVVLALYISFD